MTENTITAQTTDTGSTETHAPLPAWYTTLAKSEGIRVKGVKFTKDASHLLWTGAQEAVAAWLPDSDTDASGEALAAKAMEALGGKHRKGDASKIKTVALAAKDHGLVLAEFPNLSKAYAEAVRLTKTTVQDAADDAAADAATERIAAMAMAKAGSPEDAAMIVLAKGVDEAARLLLDALGAEDAPAHRALFRALSNEIAGRVKVTKQAVHSGPKDGATEVTASTQPAKSKAVVQSASAKAKAPAKPEPVKAQPAKVAAKKAVPVKRPAVKGRPAPTKAE